jgi:hypothetical protein
LADTTGARSRAEMQSFIGVFRRSTPRYPHQQNGAVLRGIMQLVEFEGQTVEFPDDFTDDEIADALLTLDTGAPIGVPAKGGSPASAPLKDPESSLIDTIMGAGSTIGGVLDQGARGIAEGVTNIAGLPQALGELINTGASAGLRAMGAPESVADAAGYVNPIGYIFPSAEDMQGALDAANNATADTLGVNRPDPVPGNVGERFANRIGEEVGAMAVPVGGVVARANQIGVEGARQGGRLSRMFLEPAAVDAGKFIGKETGIAAGAGLGAAGMNEGFDRDTTTGQIADLIGAIMGASATGLASTVGTGIANTGRAILGKPGYVDDVVKEAVVDRVAANAGVQKEIGGDVDTSGLVAQIMGGERISDTVPGVIESLADRTKNPGLAALEYSRQTGDNSGLFAQRRAGNASAVDAAISANAPDGSPAALRGELDLERSRRLGDAGVMRQNAEEDAVAAIMGLQPVGTSAARGNTVRTALEDSRDVARARTEDAYREADVDGNQIDPTQLTATLDEALAPLTEVERGLVPQGVIDRVRALGRGTDEGPVETGLLDASGAPITRAPEPPEPVSLKEATDLRSELQRIRRAAAADPRAEKGGRNAARVLNRLTASVDDFISRNMTDDQNAALEAARGAKFEEAEAFTRQGDPVAAALARNEGGMPKMRDERVAGTFTNPENMDRLFAQTDTPQVRAAIRSEILAGADTQPRRPNPAVHRRQHGTVESVPRPSTRTGDGGGSTYGGSHGAHHGNSPAARAWHVRAPGRRHGRQVPIVQRRQFRQGDQRSHGGQGSGEGGRRTADLCRRCSGSRKRRPQGVLEHDGEGGAPCRGDHQNGRRQAAVDAGGAKAVPGRPAQHGRCRSALQGQPGASDEYPQDRRRHPGARRPQ